MEINKLTKQQIKDNLLFDVEKKEPKKKISNISAIMQPLQLGKTNFGSNRIIVPPQEDHFNNRWYLNKNVNRIVIIGASGCGKSYELLSMIPLFDDKLTDICVFSLIIGNAVYDAIESYCQNRNMKYQFSSEVEEAKTIVEEMINSKPDLSQALIIFDDFNDSNSRSKSSPYNKFMSMCINMLRNYFCSVCILSQSYNNVVMAAHVNSNVLVLFQVADIYSIREARNTVSLMLNHPISYKNFMEVYKLILNNIHSHLIISNKKMYADIIDGNPPTEVEVINDTKIMFKGENILCNKIDNDELDKITDDEKLINIITLCEEKPTKVNINKLNKYIVGLSKVYKIELSELVNAINDKYELNLRV